MLTKIKTGELEYIFPNKETLSIVLKILEQHQEIINMNKKLIKCLAEPLFYISPEEKDTK